jgi:hypothetical protein
VIVLTFLEQEETISSDNALKKCGRCSHVNVCAVYRAVAPLINSFEVRKPFDPQNLAVICQEFTWHVITPNDMDRARKLKRP